MAFLVCVCVWLRNRSDTWESSPVGLSSLGDVPWGYTQRDGNDDGGSRGGGWRDRSRGDNNKETAHTQRSRSGPALPPPVGSTRRKHRYNKGP